MVCKEGSKHSASILRRVGLTPNGGPGSVTGLNTSRCMCVHVCAWPVAAPVRVPGVQNCWGSWNNQSKQVCSPAGHSGSLQAVRMRDALPIPGASLPLPHPHRAFLGTGYPHAPSVLPTHHALHHKRSDNSLSMSLSCCSYGSEVFRSCRKQSYGRKLAPALALHSPLPARSWPLLTLPQLHPDVFRRLAWGGGQAGPAVGQVP